jgi:CBS domain-containing protein
MSPTDRMQAVLDQKRGELWSVPPNVTVYEAIAVMSNRHIGALPVVEGGRLVGILSERDYARKVILQGRSSKDTQVSEIMVSHIITVTPEDTVENGMRLMTEHRVRHLPVLSHGNLIGIVSIGDLVNWVISAHQEEIQHLKTYITAAYPA